MPVTKHMAIKWTKAIIEIIVAIILIFVVITRMYQEFPPEAQETTSFAFLVAFIWFLVIWCIIAAVFNIIASVVTKGMKWTWPKINQRIDVLQKRTELIGSGMAPAMMSAAMIGEDMLLPDSPPPEEEKIKEGSKKTKIIVIAVVAIVILAAVSAALFLFVFNRPGAGGGTPAEVFDKLIERMNAHDSTGAVDQTVWRFSSNKSEAIDQIQKMFDQVSDFKIDVNSRSVIDKNSMDPSKRANLESNVNDLEQKLGVSITDFCVIGFNISLRMNNQWDYQESGMPAVKIDGLWYIVFTLDNNGPNGNNGGSASDTLQTFIDKMDVRDAEGAMNCTVLKFSSDYSTTLMQFTQNAFPPQNEPFGMVLLYSNIRGNSSLNPQEQNDRNQLIANISMDYGKGVEDYCLIEFGVNVTTISGTQTIDEVWACVKIDGDWYLVLPENSGFGQKKIEVFVNQGSTGTNWTVNVNGVANTTSLSLNDVYLTVLDSSQAVVFGSTQLSSFPVGMNMSGIEFIDSSSNMQLDPGDNFLLDNTMYLAGYEFRLTNAAGDVTYCSSIIQ